MIAKLLAVTLLLTPSEFDALANRCLPGIPVTTLRAIARVESAFYPLALSINYPQQHSLALARQPANLYEALAWTKWLQARGLTVSIGLMQINSEHLATLRLTTEQAFDPCLNLQAGWLLFSSHYDRAAKTLGPGTQPTLEAALSSYNSGSLTTGLANGYVEKVIAATRADQPAKRPLNPETFPNLFVPSQSKRSDNTENDPNEAPTRVLWPVAISRANQENKSNGEGSKDH